MASGGDETLWDHIDEDEDMEDLGQAIAAQRVSAPESGFTIATNDKTPKDFANGTISSALSNASSRIIQSADSTMETAAHGDSDTDDDSSTRRPSQSAALAGNSESFSGARNGPEKAGTPDVFGKYSHTNSFPEVPAPSSNMGAHTVRPLPRFQANDASNDEVGIWDRQGPSSDQVHATASPNDQMGSPQRRGSSSLTTPDKIGSKLDLGRLEGHERAEIVPDDREARFEEGVPLVSKLDASESYMPTPGSSLSYETDVPRPEAELVHGDSHPSSHDINGSSAQPEHSVSKPNPLERKSTAQVLESLRFAPQADSQKENRDAPVRSGFGDPLDGYDPEWESVVTSNDRNQSRVQKQTVGPTVNATDAAKTESDLAAMWAAALGDDDLLGDEGGGDAQFFPDDGDGFLDDSPTAAVGVSSKALQDTTIPPSSSGLSTESPEVSPQTVNQPNPHLGTRLAQTGSDGASQSGSYNHFGSYHPTWNRQQETRKPELMRAQSYADKSKGGYSSPYDLPIDVSRPRKRPVAQPVHSGFESGALAQPASSLPPRSSSVHRAQSSQDIFNGQAAGNDFAQSASIASTVPRPHYHINQTHGPPGPSQKQSPQKASTPKSGNFFEDLPVAARVRPPSTGRYTPQPAETGPHAFRGLPGTVASMGTLATSGQQPHAPGPPPASMQRQTSAPWIPTPVEQLRAPERINPYSPAPLPSSRSMDPPVPSTSRYSPAPPAQIPPQGSTRYVAPPSAPPVAAMSPPAVLPHQPRTSSPLAQHATSIQASQRRTDHGYTAPSRRQALRTKQGISSDDGERPSQNVVDLVQPRQEGDISGPGAVHQYTPQTMYHLGGGTSDPFDSARNQQPPTMPPSHSPTGFSHPQQQHGPRSYNQPPRPRTQSPEQVQFLPNTLSHLQGPIKRSASAYDPTPSVPGLQQPSAVGRAFLSSQQGPSEDVNYITPNDGRELDPLQRWKGCPVFCWGSGGTVITAFPQMVQRYSSGQLRPMVKPSPGEVSIRNIKNLFPLDEQLARFPGPLRSKGKKKDILTWLNEKIDELSSDRTTAGHSLTESWETKRAREKVLLWRTVKTLVDNDGVLEGTVTVQNSIQDLFGSSADVDNAPTNFDHAYETTTSLPSSNSSKNAVARLQEILGRGERENAVWHAVDQRLWAHALLLSSTLGQEVWKQVVQEFVRQEVRSVGNETRPLAALYEVFAGNWEESIDELVPPSARAGFQMVSKSMDSDPSRNSLEGLDQWQATLALILRNRTSEDGQGLMALGRLLSGYGRVEAAQVCYIFARSYSVFGGADDPQTNIALLGVDHSQHPEDISKDLDAILLSEVYEYGLSLSTSSPSSAALPHLQAYKLYHALILAESGHVGLAQQYCEAIANSIKSTTKPSAYYQGQLISSLENLTKRLHQSPKDAQSSWIARPSMEKVSGSIFKKFNSFVVGDESDAASSGSPRDSGVDVGPFAHVASGTPTISRSPSIADIYGSHETSSSHYSSEAMGRTSLDSGPTASRYAPTGPHAPRSSLEQQRPSFGMSVPAADPQHTATSGADSNRYAPGTTASWGAQPMRNQPPPQPPIQDSRQHVSSGEHYPQSSTQSPYGQQQSEKRNHPEFSGPPSYNPTNGQWVTPTDNAGYMPQIDSDEKAQQDSSYPTVHSELPSYGREGSGDQLPTELSYGASSYQPSYQPYEPSSPDRAEDPEEERKAKKSFMADDDDDDIVRRAADLAAKEKSRKNQEAEQNFAKAAADDARKDRPDGDKKGWFGGWFGKKDPNAGPGPIKAKLGEQSSFYYDAELKKWVNKTGGSTQTTATATPPPPKAPPQRANSTGPSGRPPSASSSTPNASLAAPPNSMMGGRMPPSQSTPSLSRIPGTEPSSGTGTPQRGGTPNENSEARPVLMNPTEGSAKPPSRPPTSMSNASSIDDLLGPPGAARKGGTVKKSKKGRGYVDVMAK
ncbi:MAG: vesicle coat component [Caeruleum heppii]|nr:MAG: vesicle coat component [Caeruleum heppii]